MNSDNLKQQQPFFGEHTQFDGTSGTKQIPSQNLPSHNYGDQTIRPDPYQVQPVQGYQSIPVGQAANVPFGHGEERKTEHVHLNPTERVNLTPDAEHVHITAGQTGSGNVEQVIRIKPDGQVQVTAEKVGEHHLEPLRKEHVVLEHDKKKQVEKVKDVVLPTETTTVVKISEHEPGTAGYDREGKLGKHDDTHHHGSHGKKEHADTHHHHGIFGKKDHADTHHVTEETKVKGHDDTHHHGIFGKKDHADTHVTEETKVKVYKEHHGKSGKKKRLSKKHKGDKTDTTTVVKVSNSEPGTAGHVKGGKHHHGTGATKVDKDIE